MTQRIIQTLREGVNSLIKERSNTKAAEMC
jgi:hypothetical protein